MRTLERIKQAFRDAGLTDRLWEWKHAPEPASDIPPEPTEPPGRANDHLVRAAAFAKTKARWRTPFDGTASLAGLLIDLIERRAELREEGGLVVLRRPEEALNFSLARFNGFPPEVCKRLKAEERGRIINGLARHEKELVKALKELKSFDVGDDEGFIPADVLFAYMRKRDGFE